MTLKVLVNIDKYFYSDLTLHDLHFNAGGALSTKYNSGYRSEFYIIAVIKNESNIRCTQSKL